MDTLFVVKVYTQVLRSRVAAYAGRTILQDMQDSCTFHARALEKRDIFLAPSEKHQKKCKKMSKKRDILRALLARLVQVWTCKALQVGYMQGNVHDYGANTMELSTPCQNLQTLKQ
ncbi:MAG: hypothetical protein A6F71_04990 [Cycloclasticus sp. symbiont of Poecilosclerida sp. M]|nr:MAG: hypothetical protein A6F71_04990 [Cycloclasticus sp. symbiont of Poecilosclerida sp. M]